MQLDALVSLKCCTTTLGSWEALLAERAVCLNQLRLRRTSRNCVALSIWPSNHRPADESCSAQFIKEDAQSPATTPTRVQWFAEQERASQTTPPRHHGPQQEGKEVEQQEAQCRHA